MNFFDLKVFIPEMFYHNLIASEIDIQTHWHLLESSGLSFSTKIVLSVEARLEASGQSGDVLLDSRVHLCEVLVQVPDIGLIPHYFICEGGHLY